MSRCARYARVSTRVDYAHLSVYTLGCIGVFLFVFVCTGCVCVLFQRGLGWLWSSLNWDVSSPEGGSVRMGKGHSVSNSSWESHPPAPLRIFMQTRAWFSAPRPILQKPVCSANIWVFSAARAWGEGRRGDIRIYL